MSKEKTLHELSKEFPDKTYRELEIYREKDRQQEAGVCVMGEMRKDREPKSELDRIKKDNNDLYNRVAELIEISESHQKLNGKLQERLTELEEENKKMHDHLNKQVENARKSGM
jgi:predicted  nucleic acid-binding Zn-ribbon protein